MLCTNCGKIIPDDSSFCGYCGEHLNRDMKRDNKEIEYTEDTKVVDKNHSDASIEQDNNDISIKQDENSSDNGEEDDFPEIYGTKQEKPASSEEASKTTETFEDKHGKNKSYYSAVDKVSANKEEKSQEKSKYDTAEVKCLPNIPMDLYKVNKSIQQSVIPAGVKVINKYNKPLSTSAFFWTQVILFLPIINIILLFIWSFRKKSNANRKAYSRSILIWLLIIIIALIIGIIVLLAFGYPMNINYWLNELKLSVNSIPNM